MKVCAYTLKYPNILYPKILKLGTSKIICHCPKIEQLFNAVLHLKDADGMTNSVDPDQTAPSGSSGSALFAHTYLS